MGVRRTGFTSITFGNQVESIFYVGLNLNTCTNTF